MSSLQHQAGRSLFAVILLGSFVAVGMVWGLAAYKASESLGELFADNRRLKQAVGNLTTEDQIGYAKVLSQQVVDGKLRTTLKFVETSREDKNEIILEREYTIEGDVIHFDAMIVSFNKQMVMDGEQRALYLWRRVYGEDMSPSEGFEIEKAGRAPQRYADIFEPRSLVDRILLKEDESDRFWDATWELANDPDRLAKYGVKAVYGNVVYSRLKPGLIYIFKITNEGHLYPETVPDI